MRSDRPAEPEVVQTPTPRPSGPEIGAVQRLVAGAGLIPVPASAAHPIVSNDTMPDTTTDTTWPRRLMCWRRRDGLA
jgi:hypothetical protein